MTTPSPPPFVRSVVHATDFSEASQSAFAHALALALLRQTSLTILHAGTGESASEAWTRFPGVRRTLERWGLLDPGSPRSAVFEELRMRVERVTLEASHLVPAMLEYLERKSPDLLVLATEGRQGLPRFLEHSVAERLARRTRTLSLFVPAGAPGFVDPDTGRLCLERVVVAVDRKPPPDHAIEYASRAAATLGDPDRATEVTLLHVGDGASPPSPATAGGHGCTFERRTRSGSVVEEIEREATESHANLLIMTTAGQHGVLDALRGSTTERVLRGAPCPLLAVPAP